MNTYIKYFYILSLTLCFSKPTLAEGCSSIPSKESLIPFTSNFYQFVLTNDENLLEKKDYFTYPDGDLIVITQTRNCLWNEYMISYSFKGERNRTTSYDKIYQRYQTLVEKIVKTEKITPSDSLKEKISNILKNKTVDPNYLNSNLFYSKDGANFEYWISYNEQNEIYTNFNQTLTIYLGFGGSI